MCSKNVYRWSLVTFNVIFVIVGVVALSLGLFMKYDEDSLASILGHLPPMGEGQDGIMDLVTSFCLLLIIGGAVLLALGLLGCCGAWKEIKLFLCIYGIILLLIVVGQVANGIFIIVKGKDTHMSTGLEGLVKKYDHGMDNVNQQLTLPSSSVDLALDMIQLAMECCGVEGHTDFLDSDLALRWNKTYDIGGEVFEAVVPISCCKATNSDDWWDPSKLEFINLMDCMKSGTDAVTNQRGCSEELKEFLEDNEIMVLIVCFCILVIEILAMVFAFCLHKNLKKEEYDKM